MNGYAKKVGHTLLIGLAILAVAVLVWLVISWNAIHVDVWILGIAILAVIGIHSLVINIGNHFLRKEEKEKRDRCVLK